MPEFLPIPDPPYPGAKIHLTTEYLGVPGGVARLDLATGNVVDANGNVLDAEALDDAKAEALAAAAKASNLTATSDALRAELDESRGKGADARYFQGDAIATPTEGQAVALARGLETEETVDGGGVGGLDVSDFVPPGRTGAAPLPHFDGSKAVAAGDWTDNGDGTWSATWAHVMRSKAAVLLHEVDSDGAELLPHMVRVASAGALVEGSYHVDYSPGTDPATSPVVITVMPRGGADPAAGGVLYRASYQQNPVKLGARSRGAGFTFRRCGDENGAFSEGDSTWERVVGIDSLVHVVTITDAMYGLIRDAVALRMVRPAEANGRQPYPFVIATPPGPGAEAHFERVLCVGQGVGSGQAARLLRTHPADGGGDVHALCRVLDAAAIAIDGGVYAEAGRVEVDGLFCSAVGTPLLPTALEVDVARLVVRALGPSALRMLLPSGESAGEMVVEESFVRGDGAGTVRLLEPPAGVALTVRNSVLQDPAARNPIKAPSGLLMEGVVTRSTGIAYDAAGTIVSNGNVFCFPSGPTRWRVDGQIITSIEALRTATGQEADSVVLTGAEATAFLDAADSGDARLDLSVLDGTPLAGETAIGLTDPASRYPVYPTTEAAVLRPDVFPLLAA